MVFNKLSSFPRRLIGYVIVAAIFACFGLSIFGQQPDSGDDHTRISKARALAASHSLTAAATELTGILSSTKDDAVRDVARIMLMDVYLEQADYTNAQTLLEQTYNSRSVNDEASTRNYFALAGQAVNGARQHIARYRSFGINVSDSDLPGDAVNDLNRLRLLLERIAGQARTLGADNDKATDAIALLEDVSSVRTVLSREPGEREQWQQEFETARQRLASNESKLSAVAAKPTRNTDTSQAVNASLTTPASSAPPAASATPQPAPPGSGTTGPANQPVAQSTNGSVELGSLADKVTRQVKPVYPPVAKSAGVSGEVTVYLEIDEKGSVSKIERSTGPKLLTGAAEEAARKWKFTPMEINGKPSRFSGFVTFRFTAN